MKLDGIVVPQNVRDAVRTEATTQGWRQGILPYIEAIRRHLLNKLAQDIDEKETHLIRGELKGLNRISRLK